MAAQRDMLYRQGLFSVVCQAVAGVTWASTTKVYKHCWKEWTGWCSWEGVPNSVISAPKLANFLLHLSRVGLVWHTVGIYQSAISGCWNLIIITRFHIILSSHKLMHYFICSILLHIIVLIFRCWTHIIIVRELSSTTLFLHLVVGWINQVIIYLKLILNLIPLLIFALYLVWRLIYGILELLGSRWIPSDLSVLGNNRQHVAVCAEMISSWVRNVFKCCWGMYVSRYSLKCNGICR